MKPGETQLFLQHLSQQTMFIDVWDGDSLLPLGSTAVDLKVSLLLAPPPRVGGPLLLMGISSA